MGIGRNHRIFQQDNEPKHTAKITKEFQRSLYEYWKKAIFKMSKKGDVNSTKYLVSTSSMATLALEFQAWGH